MTIVIVFFLLLLFLYIGMPVAFALGISGIIGLYLATGFGSVLGVMSTVPYRTAANYSLTTVPLFILMAQLIGKSGIVEECFIAARRWVERLPGGLAIACVFASAGMAAMSGSSTAAASSMATITIPEMRKHGYSDKVSAGIVTVAGTLAIMIPPSIGLILYGLITENSIGLLFIAAVIPGLLTALLYCAGIILWKKMSRDAIPTTNEISTWSMRWRSLKPLWAFIVLVFSVLGSMYLGIATPTEAAAIGAFGALVLSILKKRMTWDAFWAAVAGTIRITSMIFTIIIGAMIFGYFLTVTQATQNLIRWLGSLNAPVWLIFGAIILLYLLLGLIMDQVAILLITLPLVYPLIINMGFDPIWFGIISVKLGEIGLVTPPIGMNAYVVSASTNIPLDVVFKGTGTMLLFEAVSLILLLVFPCLSLWLPSTM